MNVPRVELQKLVAPELAEGSHVVRERIVAARKRQWARFGEALGVTCNAEMRLADVRTWCELDEHAAGVMRGAVERLSLSARAYHRVLRLARTIADLAGDRRIEPPHLAEAIQYQPRGATWDQ